MEPIKIDVEYENQELPELHEIPELNATNKDIKRPYHCKKDVIKIINQPIDKKTKDNTLDGLKLLWDCRPTTKNSRNTTRRNDSSQRISLPYSIPQANSSEESVALCNDYDALNYNIKILYKAHSECMQLNGLFEKILTMGSISATFITTMLLALKDVNMGSDNHLYITECAISGIATGFVALNNKFENGAKKQQHSDIVKKLRKLEVEMSAQPPSRDNYNKFKSRFISDLGDVTIFKKIREKYELDELNNGLF
tara:strand:- start:1035 stop:1796 length:762 start_codon:yes stop_codon:yes gene_type:complete